jgi:hypothetical protein
MKMVLAYGSRAAANPSAQDAAAGGLDVDDGAVVGVAGLGVVPVGGADGADGRLGGRRVVGGVRIVVARGDGHEDARVDERGRGPVDRGRVAAAQGHVGDDTLGAAALGRILGDEVDAGDDTGAAGMLVPWEKGVQG